MSSETPPEKVSFSPAVAAMWGVLALIIAVFFGTMGRFSASGGQAAFTWLVSTWNSENNYEHGWLVVGLTCWLVWRALPDFRKTRANPSASGLMVVLFGVMVFLAGWRTLQPRVCVASLPVILFGSLVFTHGWGRARHMIFPLSMFAFVIPVPQLQQATTSLQIIATKMAHQASMLMGMDMGISGNRVYDPSGNWGSWEIDEGCSGIRSIVALTLVTYVYGMIAHKKWSERLVIFAVCVPVAIVANAVRVTSILLVARINVDFAKTTWHDYSGFMSFGVALAILMLMSTVMRHGLRALKPKVSVTTVSSSGSAETVAVPTARPTAVAAGSGTADQY